MSVTTTTNNDGRPGEGNWGPDKISQEANGRVMHPYVKG